ncbi:hypothetical protein HN873_023658 [Arachis hypogaea]
MAQQKTSTNSSSILDPTVVVHSSESTKTSDLTSIMPIQPKKLFHSNITREAITPPNGQPHVRVGAVLPKWWTLIAFEPTPSMMLTDSQAAVAAYIFSDTLDPSEKLVISGEKDYRSTFRCFVPERCVGSRRYALSDKYTPAEVICDFLGAYMSLKISHVIRINDSTRMRLAVDLILEKYNDLCLVIQENAWQYRTKVEAEREDIWE